MVLSVVLHRDRGGGVIVSAGGVGRVHDVEAEVGRATESLNELVELASMDADLAAEADGGKPTVLDQSPYMAVRGGQQQRNVVAGE
jgi:hypothetical protein